MTTEKSRARYPVRASVQMSKELNARAMEIAERECDGSFPALVRQCLQARVDGAPPAGTDRLAEVVRSLETIRQEIADYIQESEDRLERLLAEIAQVSGNLSLQVTDMMAARDQVEKLAQENSRQGPEELLAIRSGMAELSAEIGRQNRALSELVTAMESPGERRPRPRKWWPLG